MAYSKPGSVAYVEKGKFVSAVKGLTDTFNWMISCFENLKGVGIKFVDLNNGKPKLKLNIKAGDDTNLVVTEDKDAVKIDVYYI